jgi:hypothetical protein
MIVHAGWLLKAGGFIKAAKRRWFVVDAHQIRYYGAQLQLLQLNRFVFDWCSVSTGLSEQPVDEADSKSDGLAEPLGVIPLVSILSVDEVADDPLGLTVLTSDISQSIAFCYLRLRSIVH